MTFRTIPRRGYYAQFQRQTFQQYVNSLINQYGGANWLLNDASGTVAVNKSYTTVLTTVLNELFNSWSANDFPTGYTEVNESAGVRQIDQVSSGQAHANVGVDAGTGALNAWGTDTTAVQVRRASTFTVGNTYRISSNVSLKIGANTYGISPNGGVGRLLITSTGTLTTDLVAGNDTLVVGNLLAVAGTSEVTIDDFLIQLIREFDCEISAAGVSLAQAGEVQSASAFDLNGSSGVLTLYNRAAVNGMTDFIYFVMLNPDVIGANDRILFKNGEYDVIFNSGGTVTATVNYDGGTNAVTTTTTTFSTGAWQGLSVGISSVDRIARIYKNGIECTYSGSPQAGVGNRVSNSNNILLFKDASTNGFDGKAQKATLIKVAPSALLAQTLYSRRNL